jgi:P4 family phage/plasmid primase-like protien
LNLTQARPCKCLDGRRSVAEFFVWTGSGSNGKSTQQELIMATLGKYAAPLDITFWTRARGAQGGALPELADKRSCRFCFSNEPEASDKLQVAKLKEVTGGERLTARKLYCDPVTFRPKFGVFILTNTLPELSKTDGGVSRRLRVVPFAHQFRQHPLPGQRQADPAIMEACRTNLEWRRALMRMLLDRYPAVRALHALPLPREVVEASAEYLEDNNPVGRWLAENYTVTHDPDHTVAATELHAAYSAAMRNHPLTMTAFGISMTQTNGIPKRKKNNISTYLGLVRRAPASLGAAQDPPAASAYLMR